MTSTGTQIAGATALVTGGNRGLGRAIVQELLDRGAAKVYATSRSPFTFDDDRVVTLVVDVTDDASVAAAAEAADDVSILVNNAGIYGNTPLLTAPLEEIQSEFDTNFFGILRATRAFAPTPRGTRVEHRPQHPLGSVMDLVRNRIRREQVSRLGRDQRAEAGAAGAGHERDRSARRVHGHRHDRRS